MDTRELIERLRRLVDEQAEGDAVVLVQRQMFNRAVGTLSSQAAEIERLREALDRALVWHEEQDKSLSKQPPSHGPNGNQWVRLQHQEQMAEIRAALSPKPNKEGE